MKERIICLFGLLLFLSCAQEQPVTAPQPVYLSDSNADQTVRIPPGELLGNIELTFLMHTLQGDAILLINGPGRAVGLDLVNAQNPSIVYFGEGYTGAGNNHLATGTVVPVEKWLLCRAVVYRTLSGVVIAFLQSIGSGFFEELEEVWVEQIYEIEVYISSEGHVIRRVENSGNYQRLFEDNRLRHRREGNVFPEAL